MVSSPPSCFTSVEPQHLGHGLAQLRPPCARRPTAPCAAPRSASRDPRAAASACRRRPPARGSSSAARSRARPRPISVVSRACSRSSAHHHQPIPSGRRDEDQAADQRDLLADVEADRAALRLLSLARDEVDANHRSPIRRSARPTATDAVGAASADAATFGLAASKAIVLKGFSRSTAVSNRSAMQFREAVDLRGAAADQHAIDANRIGGRLEEVERLLHLEQHGFADRVQHVLHVLLRHAVDRPGPSWPLRPRRTRGRTPSGRPRCRRCRRARCRG